MSAPLPPSAWSLSTVPRALPSHPPPSPAVSQAQSNMEDMKSLHSRDTRRLDTFNTLTESAANYRRSVARAQKGIAFLEPYVDADGPWPTVSEKVQRVPARPYNKAEATAMLKKCKDSKAKASENLAGKEARLSGMMVVKATLVSVVAQSASSILQLQEEVASLKADADSGVSEDVLEDRLRASQLLFRTAMASMSENLVEMKSECQAEMAAFEAKFTSLNDQTNGRVDTNSAAIQAIMQERIQEHKERIQEHKE
ncbi:hypothetical protein TeGR_g3193, partial [Tetraparma gracilis]